MRAGGCSMQQALTSDAASMVKQAVGLAKQRGHAQVTPLHVANTMLAASTGLFRKACLQSHSHPFQCRALELCFNVALNRLPASSSSPAMFGSSHSQLPSISNALVAAFKRAQAHQRRGSVENQQQPLLAVKIELEQLIISILDDPSVSRVMREAGFSSIKVKSNVEQAISLELCTQNISGSAPAAQNPISSINKFKENNLSSLSRPSSNSENLVIARNPNAAKSEDVNILIESFMKRRSKSIVIVGECIESLESVVRGMMDKVDKGNVDEAMREVKFISIPLFSFVNQRRDEVEQKIGELSCLVRSLLAKGVVLYLGDLKWINDYRDKNYGDDEQQRRVGYYCPVEHMIMELGRMVFAFRESGNFRLMGIATFQTYTRCRIGHDSLESVWSLHPVTMPAGSLGLSLIIPVDSDNQENSKNKKADNGSSQLLHDEKQLSCCAHCSSKFEEEVRNLQITRCNSESTLSTLPSWLKDERKSIINSNDQGCASIKELREKWNSICNTVHKQNKSLERALTFPSSSSSPSSSNSCFSYDQTHLNIHENRPFSLINPNPLPISTSSSETMEIQEYIPRFKEFNSEHLNILCEAMEKKVPWQKEILPEIAGTLLQCRSGMVRRKDKIASGDVKQETWLFFHGQDSQAKEQIARELAKIVFGSYSNFVSIALSSFSSEDVRNKRCRDEQSCSYIERFAQSASTNPHRVFFMEDFDQVDYCSQKGIKRAIERGRIINSCGEEVNLSDAIIILSCESFKSKSRACSPNVKRNLDGSDEDEENTKEEEGCAVSLDLNISLEDDNIEMDPLMVDDLGILENVDRCILFNREGDI